MTDSSSITDAATDTPDHPHGTPGAGDALRRARWAGRPGVAGRLLIAVLLPITVLAIAAGVLLSERYQTSQDARAITGQIPALTGIVKLRTALDQERMAAESAARASELRIQIPRSVSLLGIMIEPLSTARAAVDAQLRSRDDAAPPAFVTGLHTLRSEVDGDRISARRMDQGFAKLGELLAQVFADRLVVLEKRLAGSSQAAALTASLRTLSEANDVLEADAGQTAAVGDVYLDGPAQRATDLTALGGEIAMLENASARLRTDAVEPLRYRFVQLEREPAWQQFQSAATKAPAAVSSSAATAIGSRAGTTGTVSQPEVMQLMGLFASGVAGIRQLYSFVGAAERNTSEVAGGLQASSTSSFRTLLIETIFGVGLTIAIALLLARSISRPLRRLEGHARAVSNGDLELEPLQERGPKETVIATRAFNDLVSNLRLLEAKMRLLADCAFSHPMLAKRLPGRLGNALEQSIEVLSGSIVERDRLQQSLVHEATHDALTGLHNRAAAVEFLDQAIARTSRSSKGLAVFFVDLDDFKRANDTHGHAVGDQILKAIAGSLGAAARDVDFLARIGGDEFVVIAEGLTDGSEANTIAARLVAAAGERLDVAGVQIVIGARVGIAFALDGAADDSSQLLARADLALYRAKHNNSRVEIYDESLQQALIARAAVEKDLSAALDAGGTGLTLQYQPVIDASSGGLRGVEALVRWNRPDHGPCFPDEFIPAAEASDLIIQLDCWVLGTALAQHNAWRSNGVRDIGVAVNISGRHLLSGSLSEHVAEALSSSGVEPGRLTLELTETVLLTDLPAVGIEMERLRQLGVRVSIDDFGTGYTSLAHLQHLTVDEIKIDRSYVQQLPDGRESALVRMVTQAGHHIGVSIVGEGVETEDQYAALREIGCDQLQGYKIARPLTVEQFADWQREQDHADEGRDAADLEAA
jgi:diguanylate cyclase (GGDEF)-like protein